MENDLMDIKFIVYETTNVINKKIYVGVHKTNNPYGFDGYLGNGIYATQPYTYQYAKTKFQYAVKKYGPENFIRKTLAVFETEQEAYALEEEIVNESFLARDDVYNMVLGGVYYYSRKTKVFRYTIQGEYITEYDSMADAANKLSCNYTLISYAIRKKSVAKNSLWSTDKLDHLDLSLYNIGDNHSKHVSIYFKNGLWYKDYKSLQSCSNDLGITRASILNGARLGICINNQYYCSFIKADSYDVAKKRYIDTRPVYKYDSNGIYICEYISQKQAEQENKGSNITKSIKLKQPDKHGYLWCLEKLPRYNTKHRCMQKRVGKYDLNGKLVEIYDSASQAAKNNGTSVWKVLSGTNKTQKGYVYKYLQSQ